MQRFSIFLTPSAADYSYLDGLIRELCGTYGGHPFEPHVTLYSGELLDLVALLQVVSAAVQGVRPFALDIRRIDCREEYFRSLFIEFEDNPLPGEICERIRRGLGIESGYELFPHLSLLYSDLPLRHKEALAKRLVPDRSAIHFDQVKIVSPASREEGWRDTSQWRTLFRAGFGVCGAPEGSAIGRRNIESVLSNWLLEK
jgi:putative hydrolase of the HAD superfamily